MKKKTYRKKNRFPYLAVFFIVLFIFNGVFGGFFILHNPTEMDLLNKLKPPFFLEGGSLQYPLGTDELGRDILSRIIVGGRISLIVVISAITIGCFIGVTLGILSGYYGGIVEIVIGRLTDAALAFPSILLALLLSLSIGTGVKSAVISIAFSIWAKYTRTIRGEVKVLKQQNYVTQSKIMGASDMRIMLRHILPNIMDMIIVMVTMEIGKAIIQEASLSFLGLSVVPPMPSWGQMISDGKTYFLTAWWESVFPAIAIIITVISFRRLGDWMKAKKGGNVYE